MQITIDERYYLSEFQASDKDACLRHFQHREIYENTLRLPFPYTEEDFNAWIGIVEKATKEQGQPIHWALRNADDFLIGGLGFDGLILGKSHRAEIGYWLSKPYWGQDIMSAAVQTACRYAFGAWDLAKITAHVFARNVASARVLEKCSFVQEGFLRNHYLKDGTLLDCKAYGLLRPAPD